MILSVHQPHYIPWIGYFDKIAKSDCFVFLDLVQYKPREFVNRNKLRTKDGWMWLSLPMVSKGLSGQPICACRLDNTFPWRRQHWNSMQSWYGGAPFFDAHKDFFHALYEKEWLNFCDLSVTIIRYVMQQLSVNTPVYFESRLGTTKKSTERIIELCLKLHADTYLSGAGGKAYLEVSKFAEAGVRLKFQDFTHPAYQQQFMKHEEDFLPNMTILDLLFNDGPRSKEIISSP